MVNRVKLNSLISDSGLRRSHIAECIGISTYSLYKKVNGVTDFRLSEAYDLCKVLGITDPTQFRDIFLADE